MRIKTDEDEEGSVDLINLTPLLDIVFNLLIFFMVTTQFQEDERDMKIKLPDAENGGEAAQEQKTIIVNVREDGRFFIGEKPMDRDELTTVLRQAKREDPNRRVLLRVDRDTPFRHAVVVIDVCKGVGLETSLATIEGGKRK